MAGYLITIAFFLVIYTVFAPVLFLDTKHLNVGMSLLVLLGAFAFVLHMAKML